VLARGERSAVDRVGSTIEEHRPKAGVDLLASLLQGIARVADRRLENVGPAPCDAALLRELLEDCAIASAPFAPHLAESRGGCRSGSRRSPGRAGLQAMLRKPGLAQPCFHGKVGRLLAPS
jgi:hypothetical protein